LPPERQANCAIKDDGTTIECKWFEAIPESKLQRFFSPENAPNIGLFFVGFGGVIAAVFTLRSINRQAELLKRQADALDRQNKAIRDKERARIAVIFPPEEPDFVGQPRLMVFEEPEIMLPIAIAVHNEGPTKAFSVRAAAAFQFQEKETIFAATEVMLAISIPDVIRDEDLNNPVMLLVETLVTAREVDALREGKLDFYVFGEITYVDVFGFQRKTPFRFLWDVQEYNESDGSLQFYSSWRNESPPST